MKKWITGIAVLCAALQMATAEPFKISPLPDGLALGSGAVLTGTSLLLGKFAQPTVFQYDPSTIPLIDVKLAYPYSGGVDFASDILQYASFLAPAILVMTPSSEWLTVGVMYAETALFSFGLKETLKNLLPRPRPYMYYSDGRYIDDPIAPPAEFVEDGDYHRSFPSGHTTMAFAGATFASYVFSRYFPDSALRWPVFGISYALAVSTAVTRIVSGSHFLSDVIAGACIGGAVGFLVPWLHERRAEDSAVSLNTGVGGISLTIRY